MRGLSCRWVWILGVVFGCESKSPPAESAAPARLVPAAAEAVDMGQTARNAYFEMTALGTQVCAVAAPFQPAAGIEKLGVEVRLTGLTKLQVPVNPFYAELRDSAGQRFESTLAGCNPALPARQVSDGQTASGWITFDVPSGIRDLQLRYEPILIGIGRVASHHRLDH